MVNFMPENSLLLKSIINLQKSEKYSLEFSVNSNEYSFSYFARIFEYSVYSF